MLAEAEMADDGWDTEDSDEFDVVSDEDVDERQQLLAANVRKRQRGDEEASGWDTEEADKEKRWAKQQRRTPAPKAYDGVRSDADDRARAKEGFKFKTGRWDADELARLKGACESYGLARLFEEKKEGKKFKGGRWGHIAEQFPDRRLNSVRYAADKNFKRSEKGKEWKKGSWSAEETEMLREMMLTSSSGPPNYYNAKWSEIAGELGRHRHAVRDKWKDMPFQGVKTLWTAAESAKLVTLLKEHAPHAFGDNAEVVEWFTWTKIGAAFEPKRFGKSCRNRWYNVELAMVQGTTQARSRPPWQHKPPMVPLVIVDCAVAEAAGSDAEAEEEARVHGNMLGAPQKAEMRKERRKVRPAVREAAGSDAEEEEEVVEEERTYRDEMCVAAQNSFAAGQIVKCPGCSKMLRATVRARALRCAQCRAEILPKDRQPQKKKGSGRSAARVLEAGPTLERVAAATAMTHHLAVGGL